jgi:lipid II isoglutaminyl synthase (glutamine-hydrolysing)
VQERSADGGGRTALRARLASRAVALTGALSRGAHLGGGSVIGGRVGLAIDPRLLEHLGSGRRVALVSGTNGKTTTTRLLAEALGGARTVATSSAGANMPAGLVAALAASAAGDAVLEVDEAYLGQVARRLGPRVIVLLNLSRDQLDRVGEVRMVAARWRKELRGSDAVVVANADDPLVAYAAELAEHVVWVSVGGDWHLDAHHCPRCDGVIEFDENGSWRSSCGFSRPPLNASLSDATLTLGSQRRELKLAIPGRFNLANAALAIVAASELGVALDDALAAVGAVVEVAGRFSDHELDGSRIRLLLAKNPAGWTELIDLVAADPRRLVVAINARDADGHDPSWIWDVPFERLAGRQVIATGERSLDLGVRLRHAGVPHLVTGGQMEALRIARAAGEDVNYVGNYTAFQQLRRALASPSDEHRTPPTRREPAQSAPTTAVARELSTPPTGWALRVVVVHPELLGTYGDGGNATILVNRARWRGLPAELVIAPAGLELPDDGDIYCLGGGEDGPQSRSAEQLHDSPLRRVVARGAVVFAVCAGYQILGHAFPGPGGRLVEGLSLLDVTTERSSSARMVGEVAVECGPDSPLGAGPVLSGFENHAGRTLLGPDAVPLGRVLRGHGNGAGSCDGALSGRVLGTYLHGPVLARNPELADALLSMALGRQLTPLEDDEERDLHDERLATGPRRSRRPGARRR